MRPLLLLLAVLFLGAGPRTDADYFVGSWTCHDAPWTWQHFLKDDAWLRIAYGDPSAPDGVAVMGWVPTLKRFVYRDFHADGGYADLTTPGLVDGKWTFTGSYYPADGGERSDARITYAIVSSTRYDRIFETLRDGAYVSAGRDTCMKR